jgi:UV DNA damage endonuclease
VLPQLRAHADMIDPIGFEHFLRETAAGLEFDTMLEAKGKDLALLRLREQLAARGLNPECPSCRAVGCRHDRASGPIVGG